MLIHRQGDEVAARAAETAILDDETLSHAARGLLVRILRHAPEWEMNADGLSRLAKEARGRNGEGVPAIRACFRELERAGYLTRTYVRFGQPGHGSQMHFHDTRQPMKTPIPTPQPQRPIDRKGSVVYVVGERGGSKVKIGTTVNIRQRASSYQTHSPVDLEVLWTHDGDFELEQAIHREFANLRVHGEWFDFGKEDPLALVGAFVSQLRDEWYEECERQLKECGEADASFPLSTPA